MSFPDDSSFMDSHYHPQKSAQLSVFRDIDIMRMVESFTVQVAFRNFSRGVKPAQHTLHV
jgi:hypothetical protein